MRRDRWLLGLVLGGLALRVLLAIGLDARLLAIGDEATYARDAARWIAAGQLETGAFVRPPFYFAVVAGAQLCASVIGDAISWTLLLRLLQALAGAALALPVYRSARRIGGTGCARIAAGIVCFDPTLIAYSHLFWPETLYTLAVALVFDAVAGLEDSSLYKKTGVGVLIGVALLMKPVFGLFAALLAIFWALRLPLASALRIAAVVGLTAALVISPWVMRNLSRYGPSVLIENQGPYNLWSGNSERPGLFVLGEWAAIGDPALRSRIGLERGVALIAADPAAFFRRSIGRALNLWGFEFFAVRHMIMGGYGELGRGAFLALFWAIQCAWFLALALAGAGLARGWRDPPMRLLWIFAAVFTLVVSTMVGATRFRLPFALPIAVTAALGLQALAKRDQRRAAVAGLLASALLIGASVSKSSFQRIAAADYQSPRELANPEWSFLRY